MSEHINFIEGRIISISPAVRISDKFTKREFVVDISERNITSYAAMQFTNTKCSELDKYLIGDIVKVSFNIRGSEWVKDGKKRYFSNLEAWKIEKQN